MTVSAGGPPAWVLLTGYVNSQSRPSERSRKSLFQPSPELAKGDKSSRINRLILFETSSSTIRPSTSFQLPTKCVSSFLRCIFIRFRKQGKLLHRPESRRSGQRTREVPPKLDPHPQIRDSRGLSAMLYLQAYRIL